MDWRINGVGGGSATGLDTHNGSAADVRHFRPGETPFGNFALPGLVLQDVEVWDTSGSHNNDLVNSAGRIVWMPPTAEGGTIQWTPSTGSDNSATVDEVGVVDDADYNETDTVSNEDQLDVGTLPADVTTVYGVAPFIRAREEDAAGRVIDLGVRSNTTNSGVASHGMAATYAWYAHVWEQDPHASADWTKTTAEDAELRYVLNS